MPMARLVGHILDPGEWTNGEYSASQPNSDKNILNIGASIGYLGNITNLDDTFNLSGFELDLFAAFKCGLSLQAEYGKILRKEFQRGQGDLNSRGWLIQTGYRLPFHFRTGSLELAYRLQSYIPNEGNYESRDRKHSFGLNYYLLGHNFKVQADYTIIDRSVGPNNGVAQIQIQIDF
jgi:hypothetical protein